MKLTNYLHENSSVIIDKQSYHLRISKVTFLQPEQHNVRIIISNDGPGTENWVAANLANLENLENSGNLKNCQNLRKNSEKFEFL